ncbi:MAG: TRAP transporter small permease [Deltaproteobacteria bacterium]|nr:TRAP transporter small permease [Deltaproteobacteria bacterium]MBW1861834.1 TRAP transporter small permease [Deltaproteobacteria bacterium]
MWLRKTADFLTFIASPAARVLNTIAAGFLAAMMVLTGVDVFLRYIFNRPVTGSYEMTEFMMPIVIAFGLAYCALEKGHVSVQLVTSKLPERAQVVMHIFANLVFLAVFILITWQTLLRAKGMFDTGQTSIVLYIPVFPFVLAVAIGSAALCLVVLRDLFTYLSQVVRK